MLDSSDQDNRVQLDDIDSDFSFEHEDSEDKEPSLDKTGQDLVN